MGNHINLGMSKNGNHPSMATCNLFQLIETPSPVVGTHGYSYETSIVSHGSLPRDLVFPRFRFFREILPHGYPGLLDWPILDSTKK